MFDSEHTCASSLRPFPKPEHSQSSEGPFPPLPTKTKKQALQLELKLLRSYFQARSIRENTPLRQRLGELCHMSDRLSACQVQHTNHAAVKISLTPQPVGTTRTKKAGAAPVQDTTL